MNMHMPGGHVEGRDEGIRGDAREGREVNPLIELPEEARLRIWQKGAHSHETIVSKAAEEHGFMEFERGQDVDTNPIRGKAIERLELIPLEVWMMHKREQPKYGDSTLYKAVLAGGGACLIEKYPPGKEISERMH